MLLQNQFLTNFEEVIAKNWFSSFSTFWNFCPNVKVWGYNLQCSKDISSVDPCLSIHHHIISNSQRFHGFTWLSTGCVYLLLRIWMRSRCVTSHLYEVYRRVSVCVLLLCMRSRHVCLCVCYFILYEVYRRVLATSHTGFRHRWWTRGTRKMVKSFFLVQKQ